jgi:excisionase family DNA binding protein
MKLLKKIEAANHCRVSLRTIDNLMACGKLPFLRLGRVVRIDEADLEVTLQRFKSNRTAGNGGERIK